MPKTVMPAKTIWEERRSFIRFYSRLLIVLSLQY
jgi:hypothetical protein